MVDVWNCKKCKLCEEHRNEVNPDFLLKTVATLYADGLEELYFYSYFKEKGFGVYLDDYKGKMMVKLLNDKAALVCLVVPVVWGKGYKPKKISPVRLEDIRLK